MTRPETQLPHETREEFERRCPVPCPYCPDRFATTREFGIHMAVRHPG